MNLHGLDEEERLRMILARLDGVRAAVLRLARPARPTRLTRRVVRVVPVGTEVSPQGYYVTWSRPGRACA